MMKVSGILSQSLAFCVLCGQAAATAWGRRRQQLLQHHRHAFIFGLMGTFPRAGRYTSGFLVEQRSRCFFTTSSLSSSTLSAFPSSNSSYSSSSSSNPASSPHPILSPPRPLSSSSSQHDSSIPSLLDKSLFERECHVQALRLPAAYCHHAIQSLSPFLFRSTTQRSVILPGRCTLPLDPPLKPDERLLLFCPPMLDDDQEDGFARARGCAEPTRQHQTHTSHGSETSTGCQELVDNLLRTIPSASLLPPPGLPVRLTYEDLSLHQALRRLLPPSLDVPASFETVGHLAHLNLRAEVLPYKHLIAQVVLDKNRKRLQTVVNKVGEIGSTFRVLPLEVIGGKKDTCVRVKESGAWFEFDYAQVYWNSRLQGEHARIIDLVVSEGREGGRAGAGLERVDDTGDSPPVVVWDVFAGVGPFALPLAVRGCQVYANDLNPESYRYLCHNAALNKVPLSFPSVPPSSPSSLPPSLPDAKGSSARAAATPSSSALPRPPRSSPPRPPHLVPYNQDGRDFLRALAREKKPASHILMNLPALALSFLDVFSEEEGREGGKEGREGPRVAPGGGGSKKREGKRLLFGYLGGKGVVVHVYAFSRAEDGAQDVVERAASALGVEVERLEGGKEAGRVLVRHVRDVAPNKQMLCLSFPLDLVLLGSNGGEEYEGKTGSNTARGPPGGREGAKG